MHWRPIVAGPILKYKKEIARQESGRKSLSGCLGLNDLPSPGQLERHTGGLRPGGRRKHAVTLELPDTASANQFSNAMTEMYFSEAANTSTVRK